jgi:hypothetical protein
MSHIVTISIKVKDEGALRAACGRLGLGMPVLGHHDVFGKQIHGHGVQLKDWRYKVVFDLRAGTGVYDNYEGSWGKQAELDKLMQMYGVELAKKTMRAKGYNPVEQVRADGSIAVTCAA